VKVTANMVTMARIVLLPLPCALLLHGTDWQLWLCLVLFVFLGFTDFIDGYMARRDGPTRIGGLIDPVADKIFMAAIILPLVAGGAGVKYCPAWVAGALFSRELLVTALRSSVSLRNADIRTSKLAKLKTIVQMGGVGTVFLSTMLHEDKNGTLLVIGLLLTAPFLGTWLYYKIKHRNRQPPYFLLPVAIAFLAWIALTRWADLETSVLTQFIIIVVMTWISGLDYLLGALAPFRSNGLKLPDFSRLIWAIGFGALVPCLVGFPVDNKAVVLPILIALSAELATGGVDNVVVAEHRKAVSWPFLVSGLFAITFFAATLWMPEAASNAWYPWLAGTLATHRGLFAQSLD